MANKDVAVTSVTLNKTKAEVQADATLKLTATVNPSNATNKTVTFKSSDTKIATVDKNGNVKGIKAGTATITASAGGKSAKCTVTVKSKASEVADLKLTLPKTAYFANVAGTIKLKPTLKLGTKAVEATTMTYESSNTKIATVDKKGNVKAIAQGEAIITATATYSGKTAKATCTVYVVRNFISGSKRKVSFFLCR